MTGCRSGVTAATGQVGGADEVRGLMLTGRFDDALGLTRRYAERARADGDRGAWCTFTTLHGTVLANQGRFAEAVDVADRAARAADEDGDPEAMALAWNVGAVAAHRLSREDDALLRLDGALAVGEDFLDLHGRHDVLFRAACSAAAMGFAELGDTILSLVPDGSFSPGYVLWVRANQVMARCQRALVLEHEGADGAARLYAEVVGLGRAALRDDDVPPRPAAVFRAHTGFALTALHRDGAALPELARAAEVLPAEPFEMMTGQVDLVCGVSALRRSPPEHPAEPADRLVALARRCQDARWEAEIWRLRARRADEQGDGAQSSISRERFETLVERLDWRRRLHDARAQGLRSRMLRSVVGGKAPGG